MATYAAAAANSFDSFPHSGLIMIAYLLSLLFITQFARFSCVAATVLRSRVGQNYSMVLVGGGLYDNNTAIWDTIITLGGGKGVARFGVISAASEDPCCDKDSSWVYYDTLLRFYGAAEVYYIPVTVNTTEENSDPAVVEHVRTLTGFFFGGGDQLRIINSFYNNNARVPSPVLQAIKETLLATGGVVAGTSAGTDCQADRVMITGGESYQGVVQGAEVTWEPIEREDPVLLTGYGLGGIGLFPHGLLDTHFANRGRHGRLVQLLVDSAGVTRGHTRAFGVDENTAFVVTGPWNDRRAQVVGQRGVWIFSTEHASAAADPAVLLNVGLTRLSNGDAISLNDYKVSPADYKLPLATQAVPASTSSNIFGEEVFEVDRIALSLLQSSVSAATTGTSLQVNPQVVLALSKVWAESSSAAPVSSAVGYGGTDPSTGEFAYCFWGLSLSLAVKSAIAA